MSFLEQHIRSSLKGKGKAVVLGAGSVLKGDDAAGMILIEKLEEKLDNIPQVLLVAGSTAPENFTGVIKNFQPGHIFIVDAAHIEEEPGSIGIVEADLIGGLNFSTHMLPFSIMVNYLTKEIGCTISVLGIQPLCTDPGTEMSQEVSEAVEELTETFGAVFKEIYC